MIIDYSQYSSYVFCPWNWYERYVRQRQKRYIGQRSDPLCLGSLVHDGLDNFSRHGVPEISDLCITQNEPTPDTLKLAQLLVMGYIRKFPSERWPIEATEQPLLFPLLNPTHRGLAKLDGYFYVPEDTEIDSGLDGHRLTLARGWWAREYKTKAYGKDRAQWIKEWQSKMQASFQILALQHYINTTPLEGNYFHGTQIAGTAQVQGVLVRVLEKPYDYTPTRKCKACKESSDLATYTAVPDGYTCPRCGKVQQVSPYKPQTSKNPEYFSITVTRTPEQLENAKNEIQVIATTMNSLRMCSDPEPDMNPMFVRWQDLATPNRDACVNNVHRRECDYFGPHTYGGDTRFNQDYVQIDATAYMGLER